MSEHANQDVPAKVDLYIAKAAPFAQSVLHHIRTLVHRAVPDVEEAIKWSRPFFLHDGTILCNMAAFKEHCSFGFWGPEMGAVLRKSGIETTDSSGSFGRLRKVKDLPSNKALLGYLRQAVELAERETPGSKPTHMVRSTKPELEAPGDFLIALAAKAGATAAFDAFTPGSRREYIEWIVEAKRSGTRDRRIQTSVQWIAEGRSRNWKYEKC